MIFETHCHLFDEQFKEDLNEVIKSAKEFSISKMLVLGDTLENSKKAIKIANDNEGIYAAVGIFPCSCHGENLSKCIDELKQLVKHNSKVICIGEIGLDYYWEKEEAQKKEQKEFFIAQLHLADELELPVSIHARDSIEDVYKILKEFMPKKGAILHCFSSSKEMMKKFVDLGCYISLGGPVTFKNAKTPKEVALEVPLGNLLVETDSPYLAPHPYRGKRNEPKFIVNTVQEIAKIKKITYDEVSSKTYENACKLFGIKQ